jgi:hypothetical protein
MNTAVVAKSFDEKLKDRVREGLGDLLSDEELSKIIQRGIEEVFFKQRVEVKQFSSKSEVKEPLIHEIVKEVLDEQLRAAAATVIKEWATNNPEYMEEYFKHIVETGIGQIMLQAMSAQFAMPLQMFKSHVITTFAQNNIPHTIY